MDFLTVLFTTVSITIIAHRQNPFNINLFLFNVKNRSTRPKIRQIFQKKEETFAKVSLITLHLFYWGGTCSWEMKTNRVLHSVECHSERSGAQAKRSRTRRATASPSESALIFVKVFKVSLFLGIMFTSYYTVMKCYLGLRPKCEEACQGVPCIKQVLHTEKSIS